MGSELPNVFYSLIKIFLVLDRNLARGWKNSY